MNGLKIDRTKDQDEVESGSFQDKTGVRMERVSLAGLCGAKVDWHFFS